LVEIQLLVNLRFEGAKISSKVVHLLVTVLHSLTKIHDLYIYGRKFTKYLHGTWSLLNILMIFGIKEKSIILTRTVYCWLLPQIYPCDTWPCLWSRDTCVEH